MAERTIVLDPIVTAAGFAEGADGAGWELVEEHKKSDSINRELIYRREEGDRNTIHYVEDQFLRVRYAFVRGRNAAAIARQVEDRFDYIEEAKILELAEKDGDPQGKVDGLMSATVLGGQAGHARLVRLVEKRLADESSAVRRAALISVSWLEWPDFRATVEKLAKDDPAADVRTDAANLAESYGLRDDGKL
jgi:hypothetical protein